MKNYAKSVFHSIQFIPQSKHFAQEVLSRTKSGLKSQFEKKANKGASATQRKLLIFYLTCSSVFARYGYSSNWLEWTYIVGGGGGVWGSLGSGKCAKSIPRNVLLASFAQTSLSYPQWNGSDKVISSHQEFISQQNGVLILQFSWAAAFCTLYLPVSSARTSATSERGSMLWSTRGSRHPFLFIHSPEISQPDVSPISIQLILLLSHHVRTSRLSLGNKNWHPRVTQAHKWGEREREEKRQSKARWGLLPVINNSQRRVSFGV